MPDAHTKARLGAVLAACRNDPELFHDSIICRPPLWEAQSRICRSIVEYRCTVVYTGNMTGKDYLVGSIVPWWTWTRHDALTIVTAPSQSLLGSVTWKEIRRAVTGSPILRSFQPKISQGIKTSPQLLELAPGWGALGYSTTSVERASGQHGGQLLVIGEEASGIDQEIADAIESLGYTKLVLIGNPIRADGWFVSMIRQAERDKQDGIPKHKAVNAIQVPSTASPHASWEKSPVGLADKTWIESSIRRYGRDSLWVRSHILAQIPEVSSDRLIPDSWLDYAAACKRPGLDPFHPVHKTRRIACDLGEGVGRDSTAIVVRDDLGILDWAAGSSLGLAEAAQEIARFKMKWEVPDDRISWDKAGIGRDLKNYLIRNGIRGARPYAGAGRPQDTKSFPNLRSEAAWKLRTRLNPDWARDPNDALMTKQAAFRIPPTDQWPLLREELAALTYDLIGTHTRLIRKEDLCDQLGRSPDRCDALLQSFAFD
jgi:hypothetical protein